MIGQVTCVTSLRDYHLPRPGPGLGRGSRRMIIVARARITCFSESKRPLATIGKRAMSTKTIAVLDYGDLKDGQMYVSNHAAPIIHQ